jgi:hypothetical protein
VLVLVLGFAACFEDDDEDENEEDKEASPDFNHTFFRPERKKAVAKGSPMINFTLGPDSSLCEFRL